MHRCHRSLPALAVIAAVILWLPGPARADYQIVACGGHPNQVFKASSAYGMATSSSCPAPSGTTNGTIGLDANFTQTFTQGQGAIWQATAPSGLQIVDVGVPAGNVFSSGLGVSGYGSSFYWQGGTSSITGTNTFFGPAPMNSRDFGILLVCGKASCSNDDPSIAVSNIEMTIHETSPPTISASGLWQAAGWVRGSWPFAVSADSPSGVCLLATDLNGLSLGQTTSPGDQTVWHQCNSQPISVKVDTSRFGQGALPFGLLASDAAALQSGANKTLDVDNQPPAVALAGPTDAPSTAGPQYITATASAGPSGVAGISCTVDGAPAQWFAASTAEIAVAGIGTHQVQCTAENNAVDGAGVHGYSAPATYSVRIGIPTIAAVAFSKVVDKLRCHRGTERVRIPARWIKVRVRGRLVRVREKAHNQRIKVVRCHPRTVRRRITRQVTIHRHGKKIRVKRTRVVRVVVEPRTVLKTSRRIRHGHGTTVNGWLGTADGVALAGQTVDVLTAADNGRENFHVAAVTTTAVNGAWTTQLPAGPSRLIEAWYAGAPSTEAAISAPAHLIVPAKVQLLKVNPRRVAWGGIVHLTAQLKGGYLPRGGALVRLRIGEGSAVTTYGVREHVRGNGRFTTDYHFGEGQASLHRSFWFQIASLPMGDYPYAPADSRRLYVGVGGHPRPPRSARHHER